MSSSPASRRVLLLTFTHVARDPRLLRHIDALRDHYQVITCGVGPTPGGVVEHLRIPDGLDHLPLTPAGLAWLGLRRYSAAAERIPAARAAAGLLEGAEFDVLIANDIVTLPVGLAAAGERPVVMDLHEYAPREMEEDWRWRMLVKPFATALCRELPRAAAVTTVADGIAEEYQREFGVFPQTVTNAGRWRRPRPRPTGEPIRAVHSGMAIPNRRIETMIAAATGVEGLTFDLYLVPGGRESGYLESLRRQAAQTPNVRVLSAVPMADLPSTLDDYDVGVYTLPATNFNNLNALPNKFFDFVQSGLGLIIGPSPEMARLVREYGMGAVLPDFSAESLRQTLRGLDRETVDAWKANTCRSAEALSSEQSAAVLRSVVEPLVSAP